MAKVYNTSDKKHKLGDKDVHPKQSVDIPDDELDQHKQDPDTKKLFDSGELKEGDGPVGTPAAGGQTPGKK